ncbi:hypothetical protein GCM10027605_23530 [Micromonospora zhanjiangensis]
MERQRVVTGPTKIAAVLDEAVLRRLVGGPSTMKKQLEHLGTLSRRPNVDIRVLPSELALHAGMDGAFTVFSLPPPYPAVAYIENLGGRLYMEAPKSERFVRAYDRLTEAALDVHASAELIAKIAEELS